METPPRPELDVPERSAVQRAMGVGALGLSLVGTVYVGLVVAAGLAFQERQFPGDELQRIGFVAASAIDLRIGLALVFAAVLVAAGAHLDGTADTIETRAAAVLTATTAALSTVLALLAVRAQYHQLDLRKAVATAAFNISQAIYLVGVIGPAVIALVIITGPVLTANRRPRPPSGGVSPAPSRSDGMSS